MFLVLYLRIFFFKVIAEAYASVYSFLDYAQFSCDFWLLNLQNGFNLDI